MFGRRALRVVLYHHLSAEPDPYTARLRLTTPPEIFAAHLDRYARDYDVVDLDAVLSGNLPRRPLLITFDDYYASVARLAVPELRSRKLPALFFLNPGPIATRRLPLDNALSLLAERFGDAALVEAFREATGLRVHLLHGDAVPALIGEVVPRLPYPVRRELADRLRDRFGIDPAADVGAEAMIITREEVAALPAAGVEIGNHTRWHVHGRAIDAESADEEILSAKRDLEAWSGRPVRSFSYPYGNERDATATAQAAVRDSGHAATFLVHARMNRERPRGDIWYRVSFTGQPASRLPLRIELLPRLRALKAGLTGRPRRV
jgi:peptidoglycan/xylan/chitin deacetylase (PgdA/CDA1 family)